MIKELWQVLKWYERVQLILLILATLTVHVWSVYLTLFGATIAIKIIALVMLIALTVLDTILIQFEVDCIIEDKIDNEFDDNNNSGEE